MNTLQEAADYLAAQTREQWTPRMLLDAALRFTNRRPNGQGLPTFIKAAPPLDTTFMASKWETGGGMMLGHKTHWQTVPLYPSQIIELLGCGETVAAIAARPEDEWGREGQYVIINPPLAVNLEMLVMPGAALRWLADKLKGSAAVATMPETEAAAPGAEHGDEESADNGTAIAIETPQDFDETIAALFDPVGTAQLEKMFPANGSWSKWADKAKANGLTVARVGRSKFNPYLAAQWWLDKQNPYDWDLGKCCRKLANNLPLRSIDKKHLLTGELE